MENSDERIKETDVKQEDQKVHHKLPTTGYESFVQPSDNSMNEPKKKYLGVARLRRQMIKKKKREGDLLEVIGDSINDSSSPLVHVEPLASLPDPLKVRALPIYMHIITIFLLFFAGMDFSYQQEHNIRQVHSELGIQKYGIALIQRSLAPPLRHQNSGSSIQRDFYVPSDQPSNEFLDVDIQDSAQNLDPLFRVDLDELTKGHGMTNALARAAVSVHRSIVWLVYMFPLSIVEVALRIPQALVRSPPTLCLVALVVRHVLGKGILGAGIPEPIKEIEKGPIDILALAKNFVTNSLTANFPTVVGVYDAFTHLRTDMYVLLCGVFSGFVWLHLRPVHPFMNIADELQTHEEL